MAEAVTEYMEPRVVILAALEKAEDRYCEISGDYRPPWKEYMANRVMEALADAGFKVLPREPMQYARESMWSELHQESVWQAMWDKA